MTEGLPPHRAAEVAQNLQWQYKPSWGRASRARGAEEASRGVRTQFIK